MRARVIPGILLTVALSIALLAQNAQELYQRGLVQEQSQGNLQEAIKLYSQAAKTAGKDRSLAAKALLRVASCEEKLGHQAQATDAYAEVVRAYPEQRAEVTMAQDRLTQLRRASAASTQKPQAATLTDVSAVTEPLFENYCMNCHNSTSRVGGLDLASLNSKNIGENTSMWENLLRRLRARRDPPANSPRPDDRTYRSVIARLEQALDGAYSANNTVNTAERVTDTEWATRIAALIWGSAPDSSLLDDARAGRLQDVSVLNRHVVRMLRDPKSTNLIANFLQPWLLLDQLGKLSMDPAVFPQVDQDLVQSMETEARLFLESQLREDHSVLEVWTANTTYVNERLARHYGIRGVSGREFRRVTWPDKNRAGILGLSGPLTALSNPSRTSPTNRGIYVFRKFLGMNPPDPPANVPPIAEGATARSQSMRDRITAHKVIPACSNCHISFDPLGFALENFDA